MSLHEAREEYYKYNHKFGGPDEYHDEVMVYVDELEQINAEMLEALIDAKKEIKWLTDARQDLSLFKIRMRLIDRIIEKADVRKIEEIIKGGTNESTQRTNI